MMTYVLIAGAWHGSWCWSEVAPRLRAAGHRVLTPDLVRLGDSAAAGIERPLAAWADQIADILWAEKEPVVLVGHSRAGLVISEVAERVPEKVGTLVYLCAFLLQNGQTLQDVASRAENAEAFRRATLVHDDGTASLADDALKPLFYGESPEAFAEVARKRLAPEPLSAFTTPVVVTGQRFGTVRKTYIECLRDGAIPIRAQREMLAATQCDEVITLDSDHSPFFSMPGELADALQQVGRAHRPSGRTEATP
jgi:pimeloyl-ACP methyl ester carboxylesterase